MQARRNLQLFDEGFDDFKRTVSEKSGVKFETKKHERIRKTLRQERYASAAEGLGRMVA